MNDKGFRRSGAALRFHIALRRSAGQGNARTAQTSAGKLIRKLRTRKDIDWPRLGLSLQSRTWGVSYVLYRGITPYQLTIVGTAYPRRASAPFPIALMGAVPAKQLGWIGKHEAAVERVPSSQNIVLYGSELPSLPPPSSLPSRKKKAR